MAFLNGFLLLVMIDAGYGLAGCVGDLSNEEENGLQKRSIKSPNYENEYEKTVSCNWTMEVPPSEYLVFQVIDLQLHYLDNEGKLHCAPSYNLMINGKKLGCDRAMFVNVSAPSQKKQTFCVQVQNSRCIVEQQCLVREIVDNKVEITYNANGSRIPQDSKPLMNGFHIIYFTMECKRSDQANSSTTTKSNEATSSTSHATSSNSHSTTSTPHAPSSTPRLPPSTNTVAMTTNSPRTIATTAITLTTADVERMTSPFANVNWMIFGVAVAGGALIVLVIGLCCRIAARKRHQNKRPNLTQAVSNPYEISASQPDPSAQSTPLPQFSDNNEATPTSVDQSIHHGYASMHNLAAPNLVDQSSLDDGASMNSQVTPTSVDQSSLHEYASVSRPTLVSQSGPDIYASVATSSNNEKTTVHYKKENVTNILYWDTP